MDLKKIPWEVVRKILDFRPWYTIHAELMESFEYRLFEIPDLKFRKFYYFCMRNKPLALIQPRYFDKEWSRFILGRIFKGESPWHFIWFVDSIDGTTTECETLIYWLRCCAAERSKIKIYGWSLKYFMVRLLNF